MRTQFSQLKNSGFTGSSAGKESTCNVGDLGSTPGLGRSLGEEMATYSSILAWRSNKWRNCHKRQQ